VRHVTFYHKESGLLNGRSLVASDNRLVALNTPDGYIAIDHPEGSTLDHLSQKVDIETGNIVDYQPLAPSEDHEWDARARRYRLKPDVKAIRDRQEAAVIRISMLERESITALREAVLDKDGAMERLKAIDDEITSLKSHVILRA